jgi:release factor glutamine methyltransferase
MSTSEPWTVGRLLTWTTDYLKKSGSESARLDAEVLLAEARGCERIMLYTAYSEEVPEEVRNKFRTLVKRRAEGCPVAYLVGRREFFSLTFEVTPDVLIPRPETEHVVTATLDALKERSAELGPAVVADVGTGSGAIAVAVAKHAPEVRVVATDVSEAALAVARRNAERHGVADRVELLAGDLLAPVDAGVRFAVVAANLPYIGTAEQGTVADEVRKHEPHVALFAGSVGDELIARLIPQAAERLEPGGWLVLELSPMLAEGVAQRIQQDGRFEPASIAKDLAGLARIVKAKRLSS